MRRLFRCRVSLVYSADDHEVLVHSFVADLTVFWWSEGKPDQSSLWDSKIELGEKFFNEIIAHPIPFDMHTLKALKRSPLGLDLYLWLVYRTFSLKAPLCLSWKQLCSQFGADPAKASQNVTVQHFRTKCLRELKKIKRAWPDLHYHTVMGGLVLSPSPPHIPPAHSSNSSANSPTRREVARCGSFRLRVTPLFSRGCGYTAPVASQSLGWMFSTKACDSESLPSVKGAHVHIVRIM